MPIAKKTMSTDEYIESLLQKTKEPLNDKTSEILNDHLSKPNKREVDILIVCALPEEKDRVFDAFNILKTERMRTHQDYRSAYGFMYHLYQYSNYNIALVTQNSMGMASAASLTTRAILAMRPKLVAMTGICAGRTQKTSLGDIIIADQVYDYTAGKKYIDKFAPRPFAISADNDIRNYITTVILNNDNITDSILQEWSGPRFPRRISIHMQAIASGTAVIDDKQTMEAAIAVQDSLYAIDMESYGFALAANALSTKWIIIKAVQDFANGEKEHDETEARAFSSFASASLLRTIINGLLL